MSDLDCSIRVPYSARVNEAVRLSVVEADKGNISFSWDTGDGAVLDGAEATYIYSKPGTYYVTGICQPLDSSAAAISPPQQISILPEDGFLQPLGINAPCSAEAGSSVQLSLSDSELTGWDFIWNPGDGSGTVSGRTVNHVFSKPGTYQIKLTMINVKNPFTELTLPQTITIVPEQERSRSLFDWIALWLNGK
jgi:PKD repeat protein